MGRRRADRGQTILRQRQAQQAREETSGETQGNKWGDTGLTEPSQTISRQHPAQKAQEKEKWKQVEPKRSLTSREETSGETKGGDKELTQPDHPVTASSPASASRNKWGHRKQVGRQRADRARKSCDSVQPSKRVRKQAGRQKEASGETKS